MRSSVPIPGEPWPHDMVITVDDDLGSLVELLWIREAWGLKPLGDNLPPLLVDPPKLGTIEDEEFDAGAWQAAWPELWIAALHHPGAIRDPGLFAALHMTADNSTERAQLIARLTGPSWRDRFGGAPLMSGISRGQPRDSENGCRVRSHLSKTSPSASRSMLSSSPGVAVSRRS